MFCLVRIKFLPQTHHILLAGALNSLLEDHSTKHLYLYLYCLCALFPKPNKTEKNSARKSRVENEGSKAGQP